MTGAPVAPEGRPVVLVTGASRGIGRAIATRLAAAGHCVAGASRTPGPATSAPFAGLALPCDLAQPSAAAAAVDEVVRRTGRLDGLVLNSAVRALGRVADLDGSRWDEAVEVNLSSVFRMVQAALPALRRARGTVVVVGSHAGTLPFEGGLAYCTTKAALKALVEVLLLEERPHGVRTSLLNPGSVANIAGDDSPLKLDPQSVASAVEWILAAPDDMAVGELEIRPARLRRPPVRGLDRLQSV